MRNAKRKRKSSPKTTTKRPKHKKVTGSLPKKTRFRTAKKNGSRPTKKIRKGTRARISKRKIIRRKSNRLVKGKIKQVRRVSKRKQTKRKQKQPEFTGTITPHYNEEYTNIELPKGDFSDKLKAVENLPIDDDGVLNKFFRLHTEDYGKFPFAVFVTMVGKHPDGTEYYLNRILPPDQLPEPHIVKNFLIELVKHWNDNYTKRKEANQLSTKKYDIASEPDNLSHLIVKYLWSTPKE